MNSTQVDVSRLLNIRCCLLEFSLFRCPSRNFEWFPVADSSLGFQHETHFRWQPWHFNDLQTFYFIEIFGIKWLEFCGKTVDETRSTPSFSNIIFIMWLFCVNRDEITELFPLWHTDTTDVSQYLSYFWVTPPPCCLSQVCPIDPSGHRYPIVRSILSHKGMIRWRLCILYIL